MIRVVLPAHLRTLAGVNDEVQLEIPGEITQRTVLDPAKREWKCAAAMGERHPQFRKTLEDSTENH